jgi:inhibitor of KinA sporulation pathway (predicted exonuclease)
MNIIVFDVESTVEELESKKQMGQEERKEYMQKFYETAEVIEISALKLDENFNLLEEYSQYICPEKCTTVSDSYKTLVKLQEGEESVIFGSNKFEEEMKNFMSFCGDSPFFISWGFFDKKKLITEGKQKNVQPGMWFRHLSKNHISMKHAFSSLMNIRPCGVVHALSLAKNEVIKDDNELYTLNEVRNIVQLMLPFKEKLLSRIKIKEVTEK